MRLGRRAVLVGAAALSLPRVAAARGRDDAVRDALDRAVSLDPAARLALLAPFDTVGLATVRAIDLEVARADARVALALEGAAQPARYALMLERQFGAPLVPMMARGWLEAEIAALKERAASLFDRLNIAAGPAGERFVRLADDSAQHYPDDEAGRDLAVADMNGWLDVARAQLPSWFGALPPECAHVAIRRLTDAEIAEG